MKNLLEEISKKNFVKLFFVAYNKAARKDIRTDMTMVMQMETNIFKVKNKANIFKVKNKVSEIVSTKENNKATEMDSTKENNKATEMDSTKENDKVTTMATTNANQIWTTRFNKLMNKAAKMVTKKDMMLDMRNVRKNSTTQALPCI